MADSSWTSRLDVLRLADVAATKAGLIASAQILVNAVRRAVRGGYTTGKYFTGYSMASVTRSEPVQADGGWTIAVGSPVKYMLYWELGWTPKLGPRVIRRARGKGAKRVVREITQVVRGPRQFYRKEVWRPAMEEKRQEMADTFNRVYRSTLAAYARRGGSTTTSGTIAAPPDASSGAGG